MSANPDTLVAIFAMTLAAAAAKGGGFVLMRWIGRNRFVAAWLEHAPGAVLVAAAAVPVAQGGPAFWIGAAATLAAMRLAGSFAGALVAGIAAVALARWAFGG